jgi:hypothetical protein
MYFDTVAWEIVRPSFSSSPWIRGAPQSGLARAHPRNELSQLLRDLRPPASASTLPRPVAFDPWRCQPTTVSARTTCSECRQRVHSRDSTTQNMRSISVSRGRRRPAFHTAICCRSARFSSANSRCVRRVLRSVPTMIPSHLTMTGQIADQPTNRKTIAADEFSEGKVIPG